ncbi:MAG: Flp pilus assembly complex ATPase component TadA, partial [Candidatus Methylomirabilis sp.]|nr:Flp pilus assembly complex ATPase component TadA [Deltaproteobacteria bacterium]
METELFYQAVMNLLSPVEPLFERDDISEIMINGPDEVYIEREGKLVLTDVKFASQSSIDSAILNMGQFARRAVGPEHPILEARMPDGSRVTVVVPPVSKRGPVISIRKFTKITKRISDLTALGSMSGEMERFFADVIPMRKNLVVAGGAGSGKTTLLNDLGTFISPSERIVVIEDTSELELQQPHVLPLEVMLREETGEEPIDVRRLVKTALRLRPDRIIIGEVRGEEAVDLVQAMNTGHAGSMATLHSNSPLQTLMRLETMFLMARLELPIGAIRHQI